MTFVCYLDCLHLIHQLFLLSTLGSVTVLADGGINAVVVTRTRKRQIQRKLILE
jgi:hypothetical protein